MCVTKKSALPAAVLHIKISASEAKSVTSSAAACSITARPNSSHWPLHKNGIFSQELSHTELVEENDSCEKFQWEKWFKILKILWNKTFFGIFQLKKRTTKVHLSDNATISSLGKNAVATIPGIGRKSMIEYEEVDLQLSQFLQKATTTLISPVQKSLFFFS